MSSGTYFPPPVRAVEIPKSDGRKRVLGIPTVSDRVAQAVVKDHLEPIVEPKFHEDSYGYRPGKSALDAVGVARQRCWLKEKICMTPSSLLMKPAALLLVNWEPQPSPEKNYFKKYSILINLM